MHNYRTVDGSEIANTTWDFQNPVVNNGIDKLPTSTGFPPGFLKHQQYHSTVGKLLIWGSGLGF